MALLGIDIKQSGVGEHRPPGFYQSDITASVGSGLGEYAHLGRQGVVVSEGTQLLDSDGVVLIHDRDDVVGEEGVEGTAGVGILTGHGQVVECQHHLGARLRIRMFFLKMSFHHSSQRVEASSSPYNSGSL